MTILTDHEKSNIENPLRNKGYFVSFTRNDFSASFFLAELR